MSLCSRCCFLAAPATTDIYTLSLHDALPISIAWNGRRLGYTQQRDSFAKTIAWVPHQQIVSFDYSVREVVLMGRSEEHTSELQSRENLVCRLLLEKKKD